jgi:hypothetical protein
VNSPSCSPDRAGLPSLLLVNATQVEVPPGGAWLSPAWLNQWPVRASGVWPGGWVAAVVPPHLVDVIGLALRWHRFEIRDMLAVQGFPGATGQMLVVVARARLHGSVTDSIALFGTGGMNIDGVRVPTTDNLNGGAYAVNATEREQVYGADAKNRWRRGGAGDFVAPSGRWPANVVVMHGAGCVQAGTRTVKASGQFPARRGQPQATGFGGGQVDPLGQRTSGNGDGTETITAWDCQPGCPVVALNDSVPAGPEGGVSRFLVSLPFSEDALWDWLTRLLLPPGATVEHVVVQREPAGRPGGQDR